MLAGVAQETTGTLRIRKSRSGVTVEGEPPSLHTFPRKFLERELNDAVRVELVIVGDRRLTYAVNAVTKTGDLEGQLVASEQIEKPRPRRWWRRRNRG